MIALACRASISRARFPVLRTPHPDPLTSLAGTRRVLETAHHLMGATWGDEGTTHEQHAFTADPDLVRRIPPLMIEPNELVVPGPGVSRAVPASARRAGRAGVSMPEARPVMGALPSLQSR